MNRLSGTRCYLAGPMDRVDWSVAQGWRQIVTPYLHSRGVKVLDPTNKKDQTYDEGIEFRQKKALAKQSGDFEEMASLMRPVRNYDLRCCDLADFLFVNLNSDSLCGTLEEIFTANRQKKPILIIREAGLATVPDWLWGTLPTKFFFDSLQKALDYLHHIDTADEIDTLNRWWFI